MRTSTEALNLGFESGQGSCYFAACTSRHKAAGQVRLSKVASSQMYLDPNPPKRARTAAQTLEAPPTPTTLTAILTCVVTPRAGQVKATRCPVWPPVSPWSHGRDVVTRFRQSNSQVLQSHIEVLVLTLSGFTVEVRTTQALLPRRRKTSNKLSCQCQHQTTLLYSLSHAAKRLCQVSALNPSVHQSSS